MSISKNTNKTIVYIDMVVSLLLVMCAIFIYFFSYTLKIPSGTANVCNIDTNTCYTETSFLDGFD